MARAFLTAIDLSKNELQNAVIQNLASAPASPAKGQLYFNTGDNTLYWNAGTPASPTWVAAKDSGATSVFYQTLRDDGTGRTQRNNVNYVSTASVTHTVTDDAGNDESEITADVVYGAITQEASFGTTKQDGVAATAARSDHLHGNPVHDDAAHNLIKLSALAAPNTAVSFNNQRITSLATPSTGTDGANKDYVDNLITGLSWKDTVRAASTANVTVASPGTAIDGVTLATNDRVLLKDQTTPSQNGIYTFVGSATPLTRTTDADAEQELVGAAVFVLEGTANADKAFTMTTNAPITVGTTGLTWVQFGGGQVYTAGAGLSGTTTFDVGAGTGITVAADTVALDTTYADGRYTRKVSANCAAATTTTVNHAFNTRDVVVEVYRNSTPWDTVDVDVERTDTNNVLVRFSVAPAASAYRIVVAA